MSKTQPPLGFVKPHNFLPMPLSPRNTPEKCLWRCDKCDSEILFNKKKLAGLSITDVNQLIAIHYTKFACLEKEFFQKP